jgi:hypothetical protein
MEMIADTDNCDPDTQRYPNLIFWSREPNKYRKIRYQYLIFSLSPQCNISIYPELILGVDT